MSDVYEDADLELEDTEGEPNLSQVLDRVMRSTSKGLRVCLPGIVTSVSGERVDVRPAIQEVGASDKDPVLTNIRLCYPGSAAARFAFKVVTGDKVLLVFADRSLDEWDAADGEEVQASDPRTHDLSDAFAIPVSFTAAEDVLSLISEFLAIFISISPPTDSLIAVTGAPGGPSPINPVLSNGSTGVIDLLKIRVDAVKL